MCINVGILLCVTNLIKLVMHLIGFLTIPNSIRLQSNFQILS
jgi:hypothetical protein